MKKEDFIIKKNLRSLLFIATVLFISFCLFSSSSMSETFRNNLNIKSLELKESNKEHSFLKEPLDGLAPRSISNKNILTKKNDNTYNFDAKLQKSTLSFNEKLMHGYASLMYGYACYNGEGGICWFPLDDPGNITFYGGGGSCYFLSGGTWTCDEEWLCVEYNTGILWQIDPDTGDMYSIGGGGTGLNGCSWDPACGRLYGVSSSELYEIDPDTGEQVLIGNLGIPNSAICIVIDLDGTAWLWDVLFSGDSTLYNVDLESGECTEYCSIGENLLYAQDGDYDRETGILWFTAYSSTGFLAYFDFDAEELVHIGNFESGAEIAASMIRSSCMPFEHDIKVKSIDSPNTGRAEPDMDMQITVKNVGNHTETFDAQMEINYKSTLNILLDENFSGDFPPEGWETDCWEQCWDGDDGYACFNVSCESEDNSITTKPIDASEYYACNLRFRWGGSYYYPHYVCMHVKFRMNSTSPWKDVTPWDCPFGEQQEGELWEIGIYGFGEPLGEALQIKWEPFGYNYYFNYLYLDDITIEACENVIEYAELVEDITLQKGEEAQIEFPDWTPSDWQNESTENTWKDYFVHAFVILEGDQNPGNDEKWKNIELWFPWMHDVEVMSIDSPHKKHGSLPGQTFPVQATIRNVGQYAECCIPIDISIGEQIELETFLNEKAWETVPPEGWYDEHKDFDPEYGWEKSYTSKSGGFSPEASLPYYYAKSDHVMYSYAIDTSPYDKLILRFKTYINHHSGQGLYSLEAGYSTDKETWYAAWHEEPGSSGCYEVDVPIKVSSDIINIGFWVKGNPYYFNYWYIDDVELVATGYTDEYSDFACQGPDIEPGEEVTFTFEDWTPDFLQNETTGSKDYIIEATIDMEGDKNPGNDIRTEMFTLDYWHDVGIDRITSPAGEGYPRKEYEILWDNGDPDGRNALQGSMYQGYSNLLIDDFEAEEDWTIYYGIIHFIWDSGYGPGNLDKLRFYIFENLGDCDPSKEEYPEEGYYVEANTFDEYTTGDYYFSRPEIIVEFKLDEEFTIPAGNYYVSIQPDGVIDDIAYLLTSESKGCMVMADLPYWGYPRWTSSQEIWDEQYDLAWKLTWHGCLPPTKAWIKPGTQDIDAVAKNYGTFPKKDLICYAEIREYITDPKNGTQVYTDEIGNIDLLEPLGGEKNIQFTDFTFAEEGRYGLFMQLPAEPDDEQKNNQMRWGVWVDDTSPSSDYPPILDPPYPDGENGWYVNDVIVTLNAYDPWSHGVSSGVKEIRYTINGGEIQVISGNSGSFVISKDGEDIEVEYWAIDWVGNEEAPHNTFTIDMDQTVPEISLSYEVTGGNPFTGWKLTFTATANDETSGMDRVEFYFNDEYQKTITGSGPTYQWTYTYYGDIKIIITAIAYDKAGNFASDQVIDPKVCIYSNPKSNHMHSRSSNILKLPHIR